MKKVLSTKAITEIAILTAIAYVLDALQGGIWRGLFPNGGSIGFAMLPILVLSYRRGLVPGLIAGFILSFIQMLGGVYAISDTWYKVIAQVSLDYILAYPCVAFAGVFFAKYQKEEDKKRKLKWLISGAILGGMLKYSCHVLAGFLFWPSTNYASIPLLNSLLYNGFYMIPNIIVNTIVLSILSYRVPILFKTSEDHFMDEKFSQPNYAKWLPILLLGIAIFVFALMGFIQSYEVYVDEFGKDISFNEDYVVLMIISIILSLFSIIFKQKGNEKKMLSIMGILISSILCFYPLGVFFKAMNKGKPFVQYQFYLYVGVLAFFVLMTIGFIFMKSNIKKKEISK